MSTRLTYTKAIKNGKLKATEMAIGESVTGTLLGFKPGKYGSVVVLDVQGREVDLFPAGNLKFLERDVAEGKKAVEAFTTITRVEDKQIKGYNCTQFVITQGDASTAVAATAAPAAPKADLKARLDAIKNNRTVN
jgi:hypothetical protein